MIVKLCVFLSLVAAGAAQSTGDMRLWNAGLGRAGAGDLLSRTELNVVCPQKYDGFSIRCYYPPGDNKRSGRAGTVKFYVNGKPFRKERVAPYFMAKNRGWLVHAFPYKRVLKGRKRFTVTCRVPTGKKYTVRILLKCKPPPKSDCLRLSPADMFNKRLPAGWKKTRKGLMYNPSRLSRKKKDTLLLERYSPSTTRYACALDMTTWGGSIMMRSSGGLILRAKNAKDMFVGTDSWSTVRQRWRKRSRKAKRQLQAFVQMNGKPYSVGTRATRAGLSITFEFLGMDKVILHGVVCFPCEDGDCLYDSMLWKMGAKQCSS